MYGEGATTSAIEHRFRPFRRMAEAMRGNAPDGISSTVATPQSRSRTERSTIPGDTAESPTPRSGRKRTTKKGSATKKSAKSTDNTRNTIAIGDGDEDNESNVHTKRAKRETSSPTPRNQLPDINAGRTAFFDSSLNGYELALTEASTNLPEQDESVAFNNVMDSDYAYSYFDEA